MNKKHLIKKIEKLHEEIRFAIVTTLHSDSTVKLIENLQKVVDLTEELVAQEEILQQHLIDE